ncbi:RsiV family protein [Castellaniella sp.]|uniref:RsiV family protein n=1 Tax=Castellaniella sp. TaxID=1955812 RepID=UPI0025BA5833|nr:RsiV family protein [Castellaniella sp.]
MMIHLALPSFLRPLMAAMMATLLLGACASGPKGSLSLVPAELNTQTQKAGLFSQPINWNQKKPGCKGECPTMMVNSLVFPGHQRLTELVDHALALMTWVDNDHPAPYDTVPSLRDYFWKTAGPRDEIDLNAKTRYRNPHLTVVELQASEYRTGMAHGISGTQFLIWRNDLKKAVTLDNLLLPGARPAFDAALRKAHTEWLAKSPAAREDPANFRRLWPFVSSDNVALTDTGIVVKYQPYEIAPYSSGQPELLIPYSELKSILRPEYLPPA